MSALAIVKNVERALALLEQASTLEEVLYVRNLAHAAQTCAELVACGSKAHAAAYTLCKRAERKLGEFSAALPKAPAGRKKSITPVSDSPVVRPKGEVLRELGVERMQASRAEKLAAIPLASFNERLEHAAELVRAGKRVPELTAVTAAPGHQGDEWGTPSRYLEAAREVYGGIELDVASNARAQELVRADRYFTAENSALDDGVTWDAGTLWWQPPFSGPKIKRFAEVLAREWSAGHIGEAIGLSNTDATTVWWRTCAEVCAGFVLFDHRIAFLRDGVPFKGNQFPGWAFYCGPNVERFFDVFSQFGTPCTPALRPEAL